MLFILCLLLCCPDSFVCVCITSGVLLFICSFYCFGVIFLHTLAIVVEEMWTERGWKKWIYLYFSIIVQDSHIIVLMCFASICFDDYFNPSQSLRVLSFLARISAFSITVLHRCTICVIFRKRICVRGVQSWYKLCEQKKSTNNSHKQTFTAIE